MPNPICVLPDPLLAIIRYLRTISEVTALISADHILTAIPAQATDFPYIIVSWGSGAGQWPAIDHPSIQVDVLGGSRELCNQIARTVRAAVWAIANDVIDGTVLVSGEDLTSPQWLPDTTFTPPLSRYTARYRLTIHN